MGVTPVELLLSHFVVGACECGGHRPDTKFWETWINIDELDDEGNHTGAWNWEWVPEIDLGTMEHVTGEVPEWQPWTIVSDCWVTNHNSEGTREFL